MFVRTKLITTLIILVNLIIAGCKESTEATDETSELNWDPWVAEILALQDFDVAEREEICQRSVLMVFVGNGEDTHKTTVPANTPPPPPKLRYPELKETIDFEIKRL